MVGTHLHETTTDGDKLVLQTLPVHNQLAICQSRHQWGMVGKNPQLPLDAGCYVQVLRALGPPSDHPVSIHHPEGAYLTGLLLRT